ncbi:MAG: UDP-N-acetylglucosamine--N-acetylmuramyl-(pentapeptide) pyrophosphoryl-undecaprenol N-acetylglucosamine transferase [Candidatus Magasanikbacteria bacterium]|nr:UDP-N-acetylglucosamine--N-acetylmuramyl-(pentapeptide) pyrophosphoryl-undecaprenol N-acetylglucosamine transferase [Candidatus Magasanikbacteria bacterium]
MKIVLSGGGTLGPVIPLLAVRDVVIKKFPSAQFVWVGTKIGPEREIVEKAGMPFFVIGAGKWRRYMSLWNIIDIIKLLLAFVQAFWFLIIEKPNLVISAGGFVSVPLHTAAWFLGVPAWVHQQDVRVGFANRLMFPGAKKITTALKQTTEFIGGKKVEWIGNPCRESILQCAASLSFRPSLAASGGLAMPQQAISPIDKRDFSTALRSARNDNGECGATNTSRQKFNIPADAPIIFVLGGGTGSANLNKLLLEALQEIPTNWHIIHLVGKDRPKELALYAAGVFSNYHVFEFFTDEMKDAYALADVVVARAGFGTLTELAALSKAAIILPMYGSHQEDNARFFAERDGIILMPQAMSTGIKLAIMLKDLMENPAERAALGTNLHSLLPTARPEKIIEIVESLLK